MGDILNALIDPGYQTDDLMYLVTKLEVKIELGSPFWARPKLECQFSWPFLTAGVYLIYIFNTYQFPYLPPKNLRYLVLN